MLSSSSPDDDSGAQQQGPIGLADTHYSSMRREMLDIANKLYGTGVTMDIEIPMIAVIGQQSAGKSSLLEAMSGVTLPRASGTCTRCPTECRLSYSMEPWTCRVSLRFTTDAHGQPIAVRTIPFGDPISDKAEVADRIKRGQQAILNPQLSSSVFLNAHPADSTSSVTFSTNCILLEISGPDVPDLTLVDLPGLIASAGTGGNESDIELIKNLVTEYVSKDSCIILLTIACETDFENQAAYHLAKTYDPQGVRTIGVLTKPDRAPQGDEERWISLLKNEIPGRVLENGWFSVKQPDSVKLAAGISPAEARQDEKHFFAATSPWSGLPLRYQRRLGTVRLAEQCGDLLAGLISKSLPNIHKKIQEMLITTEEQLSELPNEPSKDPVSEVYNLISRLSAKLSRFLEGTPGADGLLQEIRPHQVEFKKAIRATAPDFRPYERRSLLEEDDPPEVIVPEFLSNEEEQYLAEDDDEVIYVDDVLEQAQQAITRELPDYYPFVVVENHICSVVKKWGVPTYKLFDKIGDVLSQKVNEIIKNEFEQYPYLQFLIISAVTDHIQDLSESTKQSLAWLLKVEERPRTWNDHYYSDYRDKFLAHYKASRPQYNNAPLVERLKANHQDEDLRDTVNEIISGFSDLGIHGVTPPDLPKVLPSDPYEAALGIMASVRAYFQVAYKRFVDNVPIAIDYELVLGLVRDQVLETLLREHLGISGPDGHRLCSEFLKEDAGMAARRGDLRNRRERLNKAKKELLRMRV